jgi:hypothetical protein
MLGSPPASSHRPDVASVRFASRSRRAISWSVMVGSLDQCCVSQLNPTQVHRGDRLLHRAQGHDLLLTSYYHS